MRLALSLKGIEWDEQSVDMAEMKSDLEKFPFGQCPRYVDGDVDLVQSNTILRFIGRKYGLAGATDKEYAIADMVMEGVESLRSAYLTLIYQDALAPEAIAKYLAAHLNKEGMAQRNKGAHVGYLSNFVTKSSTGYVAGTPEPSMGDVALWDMLDLYLRIPEFKANIVEQYPELMAFHSKFAALPNIKAYLESPKRVNKINANNLG